MNVGKKLGISRLRWNSAGLMALYPMILILIALFVIQFSLIWWYFVKEEGSVNVAPQRIRFIQGSVTLVKNFSTVSLILREKCPNTEFFWSVFSRIHSRYGKIRTRKTPCLDTFHAVLVSILSDENIPLYRKSEPLQAGSKEVG